MMILLSTARKGAAGVPWFDFQFRTRQIDLSAIFCQLKTPWIQTTEIRGISRRKVKPHTTTMPSSRVIAVRIRRKRNGGEEEKKRKGDEEKEEELWIWQRERKAYGLLELHLFPLGPRLLPLLIRGITR